MLSEPPMMLLSAPINKKEVYHPRKGVDFKRLEDPPWTDSQRSRSMITMLLSLYGVGSL